MITHEIGKLLDALEELFPKIDLDDLRKEIDTECYSDDTIRQALERGVEAIVQG